MTVLNCQIFLSVIRVIFICIGELEKKYVQMVADDKLLPLKSNEKTTEKKEVGRILEENETTEKKSPRFMVPEEDKQQIIEY